MPFPATGNGREEGFMSEQRRHLTRRLMRSISQSTTEQKEPVTIYH